MGVEDACRILGISQLASKADIKTAYRLAALRTHPDRPGGSDLEFKQAAWAYRILCDPSLQAESGSGANTRNPNVNGHHGLVQRRVGAYDPLRTVNAAEAEQLFRDAFDGKGVEEVLRDMASRHADGRLVNNGLHSACMREALYNKLLIEVQERARLQNLLGDGDKTTVVSREILTTEDGKSFVKVKTITYWRDGRVENDIVMKERFIR